MTPPEHPDRDTVDQRIAAVRARRPRLRDEHVTLAHGAGGKASRALVDAVFLDAFDDPALAPLGDAAVLDPPADGERLAVSTDSFVVQPRRFPGGSIGDLAVNGTINDVVAGGGRPAWLSVAFVIEEGLAVEELRTIVADMAAAARSAGVRIVTGDTKVVQAGAADGVYITTTGVGHVPVGRQLDAGRVRPGDAVILTGTLADHGMAVMLARGELAIEADVASDTAAMHELAEALHAAAPDTRWLRDPTRGGLATSLDELAQAAGCGVVIAEEALPVRATVAGACDLLGIDPIYVANEGKLVAIVPAEQTESAIDALRSHPLGADAAVIGEIRAEPVGTVVMRTAMGGTRVVDMLVGDPLPRIC
ncbi:MAG: hydrogenase expression/formation protein HypE [Nitriliruptoraceae bacterium]